MGTALTLSVIIIAGTAAALFLSRGPGGDDEAGGRLGPPVLSLAVVVTVIYINQVLFTVYVIRVRHGDPSFIARYLPPGWFALARGHAIEALARQFPDPGLLAPAVLRVQAFLELPFVVFAYLTVSRWFSAGAYRMARRLVWPTSASCTATFCLIEWSLHNPYTADDIVIRIAAAIVVPLWAGQLAGAPADRVPNLPALLVFAVSAAALSLIALTVYDTALLYNLGHLGARLPAAAGALAALAAARVTAPLMPRRPPGPGVESIARSFGAFLPLFFVPALPVRYGLLGWGTAYLAAAAAFALVTVAAVRGIGDTFARSPVNRAHWLTQMAITLAAGFAAGATASMLLRGGYPETRLLRAATAFFICATATCALIDLRTSPRSPPEESTATPPATAAGPPLDHIP
ncbi:MAG TPA: hypothetical protein VF482_09390 [Trebonia sp.]